MLIFFEASIVSHDGHAIPLYKHEWVAMKHPFASVMLILYVLIAWVWVCKLKVNGPSGVLVVEKLAPHKTFKDTGVSKVW